MPCSEIAGSAPVETFDATSVRLPSFESAEAAVAVVFASSPDVPTSVWAVSVFAEVSVSAPELVVSIGAPEMVASVSAPGLVASVGALALVASIGALVLVASVNVPVLVSRPLLILSTFEIASGALSPSIFVSRDGVEGIWVRSEVESPIDTGGKLWVKSPVLEIPSIEFVPAVVTSDGIETGATGAVASYSDAAVGADCVVGSTCVGAVTADCVTGAYSAIAANAGD